MGTFNIAMTHEDFPIIDAIFREFNTGYLSTINTRHTRLASDLNMSVLIPRLLE